MKKASFLVSFQKSSHFLQPMVDAESMNHEADIEDKPQCGGDGGNAYCDAFLSEEDGEDAVPLKAVDHLTGKERKEIGIEAAIPAFNPKSPYCAAGDGLRGIGVIMVVFYHMGYEQIKNAWFCISLFFAFSGFLMTKTTIEAFERRGFVDVHKFWAKRISRLFPALFITVILIVLSQKLPSRVNDGVTFQREATDLIYATLFATNYNLVYNQVDDYFDEFSNPSITRHLWTLSIEEQYYIIWPIVLWLLTKCFGSGTDEAKRRSLVDTNKGDASSSFTASASTRRCLWAIFTMDVCVVTFSYFSSLATLEKMGMSAAYYSTWCRMGDIAAGGLAYSAVRLYSPVERRWYRDPTLPPLTTNQRIFLEVCVGSVVLAIFGIPIIPLPVDDMLQLYFGGFRLLMSIFGISLAASAIQASEPLPRWAIASRLVNMQSLDFVGVISYGVYVFHWPLLVYFGDAKGIERKKDHEHIEETFAESLKYDVRNFFLFVLVLGVGYVSFMFYEKPMLMLSRRSPPKKTIMVGLAGMAATLMIIWLITKDLDPMETFENDLDELYSENVIFDPRFTPLIPSFVGLSKEAHLYKRVLDYNTRSMQKKGERPKSKLFDVGKVYHVHESKAQAIVVVACKVLFDKHPCDHLKVWTRDTYWIWLESEDLCSAEKAEEIIEADPEMLRLDESAFQRRCDDDISISELSLRPLPDHAKSENKHFYDGAELPLLYEMTLGVDDAFPGVLNQNTVSRLKREYALLLSGELDDFSESAEPWNPIKLLTLGESIAERIGMFWKDYIKIDMPLLQATDLSFPTIELHNMGIGGNQAIPYFTCLADQAKYQHEMCYNFTDDRQDAVLNSIKQTRPNVVVIHDEHWATRGKDDVITLNTPFERVLSFNILMTEALTYDVESIFFVTRSPRLAEERAQRGSWEYITERNYFMQMVDTLACSKEDPSSIRVTAIDWAALICPGIANFTICEQAVHGFDYILPDGWHPSGDSGLWLTREMLAIVVAQLAQYNLPKELGSFSSWDEAMENPLSKQLMNLAPSDGQPALSDIVSGYYMCPYSDLEALESDYKQATFPEIYRSYRDSVHYVG